MFTLEAFFAISVALSSAVMTMHYVAHAVSLLLK